MPSSLKFYGIEINRVKLNIHCSHEEILIEYNMGKIVLLQIVLAHLSDSTVEIRINQSIKLLTLYKVYTMHKKKLSARKFLPNKWK